MEAEEVIVTLGSNTDDYVRGLDEAERKFMNFARRMESTKLPNLDEMMGMGGDAGREFGSHFMAQADLMLGAAAKMGSASSTVTSAVGSLDRALGMPAPTTFVNQFSSHASLMLGSAEKMAQAAAVAGEARMSLDQALGMSRRSSGGPMSGGTVGASQDQLAQMRRSLGMGAGTVGASPDQLSQVRQAAGTRMNALIELRNSYGEGPNTYAVKSIQDEINSLRKIAGIPEGYGPGVRRNMSIANMGQFRPEVFGKEYRRDRFGGGRLPPGRGGSPMEDEGGGFEWNWMSSIMGGIGGRMFGGHLAGLGGMLGGGVGGPIGAIAGIGAGMGISATIGALEKLKDVGVMALSTVAHLTYEAAKAAVKLGMEYERTNVMFGVMIGDKARGQGLFGELQQVGINTPYTTRQITDQAQVLLGYGYPAGQTPAALTRLGDIAAGDPEKLRRLTLAFGQVQAHGRFMGQELRQFAEAGVGAGDFAKAMGISTREFRDKMHDGAVSPNVMYRAINMLTEPGGRFYGSNRAQMQTVGGSVSNVVERLELAGGQFGAKFFERFNIAEKINSAADAMAGLNTAGDKLLDWLERADKALDPFKSAFMVIKNDIAGMFDGLTDGIKKWEDLTESTNKWATVLVAAYRTVKDLVGAVPELGGDFVDAASGGTYRASQSAPDNPKSVAGRAARDLVNPDLRKVARVIGEVIGGKDAGRALESAVTAYPDYWTEAKRGAALDIQVAKRQRDEAAWNAIVEKKARAIFGGGRGGFDMPMLSEVPMISPEAENAAQHLKKQMAEGTNPLEKFNIGMKRLNEAFEGPIPNRGEIGGGVQIPPIFGLSEMFKGSINQKQFDFGRTELAKSLISGISDHVGDTPAMQFGSSAAFDTIARSEMQQTDLVAQMLVKLDQAKTIAEQHKEIDAALATALMQWMQQNPDQGGLDG
jgi:tape measure domain-containing protein